MMFNAYFKNATFQNNLEILLSNSLESPESEFRNKTISDFETYRKPIYVTKELSIVIYVL